MFKFLLLLLFSSGVYANSCVVLLYHNFSDLTPKSTSISPKLFEEHLQYLKQNNFNVLSLKTMLENLNDKNLPPKCVVLTADDAYISIFNNAYPLLKKYDTPMAIFAATEPSDKKYRVIMNWQQMRDIQGKYIQFYNHSTTHSHLLSLSKNEIESEIKTAQKRLKQELGVDDKVFAYPYGEANLEIYQQLQEMGYIAFGQHSGALSYESDLQNLPRFPMAADFAKMKSFKTKVNTLAMPIKSKNINTVLVDNHLPTINLDFKQAVSKDLQRQFNCFYSGDRIKVNWLDNKKLEIPGRSASNTRRSRYNCTMPTNKESQYYWHSLQFTNPNISE